MPSPAPEKKRPPEGPGPRPGEKLSTEELLSFVEAVLAEMVKNRDVKWDRDGKPLASLRSSGETAECSWVHFLVDMSAIGMPMDTTLIAHSYEGETGLEWTIGSTPLAVTPKGTTAKATADALNMNVLLAGFRQFVSRP